MLKSFKVGNFKSFENDLKFDLSKVSGYSFNPMCIKNGLVNNAIIYGYNGSGKSNLGLAIFDIMEHLTDIKSNEFRYSNYLNAGSGSDTARFEYIFQFSGKEVIYRYAKTDYRTLEKELLLIDGKKIIEFDREGGNTEFFLDLEGAETLNRTIGQKTLSALKYVRNNTVLTDEGTNAVFNEFFSFVENMVFFRSLEDRVYIAREPQNQSLFEEIISKGKVKDFESFLHKANIDCRIDVIKKNDTERLAFRFKTGKEIELSEIWSTGTSALTLFYCWYLNIIEKKVSFLFIDEFDAFYHFDLSKMIISRLKESGIQFVLTTHNTSNLSNDILRPDCYFLMTPKAIGSLANCTDKELREAHNIEKMYKSGTFDVE